MMRRTGEPDVGDRDALGAALEGADLVLQPRGSPPRRRLAGNPRPRGECRRRDQPLRRLPRAGDRAAHLHQCRRSLSYRRSDTGEERAPTPFIAYGRTKLLAEQVHRAWASPDAPGRRSLLIVRPAVVFGEGNRGNVSQLLRQIASGRSMMVGGHNRKSMAYVGNVSAFQVHALGPGFRRLPVQLRRRARLLDAGTGGHRIADPRPTSAHRDSDSVGYLGGVACDLVAALTRRLAPICAIRVRKFCSTTTCSAHRLQSTGVKAPTALREALIKTIKHEVATGESLSNPM